MMNIVHMGTNQKYRGPAEMVLAKSTVQYSWDASRMCKGISGTVQMLTAIITTQLTIFKGSRL